MTLTVRNRRRRSGRRGGGCDQRIQFAFIWIELLKVEIVSKASLQKYILYLSLVSKPETTPAMRWYEEVTFRETRLETHLGDTRACDY